MPDRSKPNLVQPNPKKTNRTYREILSLQQPHQKTKKQEKKQKQKKQTSKLRDEKNRDPANGARRPLPGQVTAQRERGAPQSTKPPGRDIGVCLGVHTTEAEQLRLKDDEAELDRIARRGRCG